MSQIFLSFYLFQEQKRKEYGPMRGSGAQSFHVAQVIGDVDNNSLNKELETCKHVYVDSEMENGRDRVNNFAMDTLDPEYLLEELDVLFDSFKCAAKLIVAFGFVLKNVGDGSCR